MDSSLEIIFKKPKLRSAIILSVYLLFMIACAFVFSAYVDQTRLQQIIQGSGPWGIIIYAVIEVVYVTFTPLLNTFILIVSGYLFGGHVGFVINFLSTSAGLLLIVFLVKHYGRPLLQKIISPHVYQKFDQITQRVGPITLLIVYVLPFTPDDELTYIVAAGATPFKRFIIPIVLGTIAKSAYSYIGDRGTQGIVLAGYARVAMLILGLILVGIQEYVFKKRPSLS